MMEITEVGRKKHSSLMIGEIKDDMGEIKRGSCKCKNMEKTVYHFNIRKICMLSSIIRINLPLFSTVLPSNSCCFRPVGLSLL